MISKRSPLPYRDDPRDGGVRIASGTAIERVTTAWMQEVEQRMEQLPRVREK